VSLVDMLSRMVSSLPDALDQVEHVGALLVAHGIAENTPEQADIGPQPRVFLQRQRVIAAIGPGLGLGRHGLGGHYLGRHGWLPQKLPGNSECASFLPQCKIKMGAAKIPITPSWPGLSRPSTSSLQRGEKDVDARDKPGHDDTLECPIP
jgi:hypothetical protein